MKIGFIGLGKMGSGIARNLITAGYPTAVYDASSEARGSFEGTTQVSTSLEELLSRSEAIMMSLPGSPEVEDVVGRLLETGVQGKTIVDLSTSYPYSSIALNRKVKEAGGSYLDASLAGGPKQAAEGTLTVMVGGDRDVFDNILPIFNSFAKRVFYAGGPGSGNTVKLASNYFSILYVTLYAEMLPFVEKLGVDPNVIFDVVSSSGSNSPIFQLFAPKIINENYDMSFRMDLAIKDLSYIKRLFQESHAPSAMLDAGLGIFEAAREMGLTQNDTSEIAKVVRAMLAEHEAAG